MNPFLRASIELEHPFAFGAFFCAVFALGSSCSSDPSPAMELGSGGEIFGAGAGDNGMSTGTGSQAGSIDAASGGDSSVKHPVTGGTGNDGTALGTGGDMITMPEDSSRSVGCDSTTQLAEGEHRFMLEGDERRYIVRLPEGYKATEEWPLVFALHPNGSGGGYWDNTNVDSALAARDFYKDKAILIVTEAIGGNWRDYGEEESLWDARLEVELAYFDHLLADTKLGLCVDEKRIYSIGFSGGGSFSGVLACRRDDLRAFAAGGAVIYFKPEDCVQNPSAWVTIGDGEQSDLRSDFRDYFRSAAGCQATSTAGQPEGCQNYEGCGANPPAENSVAVSFCSHPGGHEVPHFFLTSSWNLFESLSR